MKKLLILFTKAFPFNTSEPFLENEYPFYKDYFDKVLIVTGRKKGEAPTRLVEDPTIEFIYDYTLSKDLKTILFTLPFVLFDKKFYKEIKHLILTKRLSLTSFYDLLPITFSGNNRARLARKWLRKNSDYNPEIIYSYWLHITAYAAIKLNEKLHNKCFIISRAHGFDVYSERRSSDYLPFQSQMIENINEISVVSHNGKNYLQRKYPFHKNINVRRLGAIDKGFINPISTRETINLVSCSRIVAIKRINRIADALSKITDKKICWTHIGGGPDFDKIKLYSESIVKDNIRINFVGTVPNTKVYEMYAEQPFHAFINVSEVEGLPVSIMEALSFGIPVIATDVGGTSEIVDHDKNGYLLSKDFDDEDLCNIILKISAMDKDRYYSMRTNARHKYESEFNALDNYKKFVENLADRGK